MSSTGTIPAPLAPGEPPGRDAPPGPGACVAAGRRATQSGAHRAPARDPSRAHATHASAAELAACAAVLALIAAAMCAAHIRHGGLYYDDWSVAELGRFPPAGGLLHGLWLYYGQRPGQVLYYAALDQLVGVSTAGRLALAAAAVALQASVLYALLRRLGLRARDALACAALSLTLPFADSVWLWGILSLASLAIAASLLGVITALRAFERSGRRALLLHGVSLALYVGALLSYEIFAVAGCLAGLSYVRAVGFARARLRWALDVLAIAAATLLPRLLAPIDIATPSRAQTPAGMLGHAALVAVAGARVIAAAILPIRGLTSWIGVGLLVWVLTLAAALHARLPHGDRTRAELGRWLVIAAAGAALAMAGWAVYVPAPNRYLPSIAGTVNRVNALAGIGIALLCYSLLMLGAHTLVRILRMPARAGAAVAAVLALALCLAYLHRGASDTRWWDLAARDQREVLAELKAALPRPPRGAVVLAYDAPQLVGPGVPVLNTRLDLTSAAQLAYARPSLTAAPLASPAELRCADAGALGAGVGARYGASFLVDLHARRAFALADRAGCRLLLARAAPSMSSPAGARAG